MGWGSSSRLSASAKFQISLLSGLLVFLLLNSNTVAFSFDATYRKHLCVAYFYNGFEKIGITLL